MNLISVCHNCIRQTAEVICTFMSLIYVAFKKNIMENNSNRRYPERGDRDTPNNEEFINSNPNESPLKDGSSPASGENMRRNADTDPNRYSNFNRDDTASDGSENVESPSNDQNAHYTGHSYSNEDDSKENRPFGSDSTNIEQSHPNKSSLTENDKDGFFEGL